MIPINFIENWRVNTKWQTLDMVEQDLIINRALVELYNNQAVKTSLVFRGGTALYKLFIKPPGRYSEDLDFVQKISEPIGKTIDVIRDILQPWLGSPKWKVTERSAKIVFSYSTVNNFPAKLKIEINTTEHFQVLPLRFDEFNFVSDWYKGSCVIPTYELSELIATKLRALYQRRKGRDLFDLWYIFTKEAVDIDLVISIFHKYCANEGLVVSKDLFMKNLEQKKAHEDFRVDMNVLLPLEINWDFDEAFEFVWDSIISKLK